MNEQASNNPSNPNQNPAESRMTTADELAARLRQEIDAEEIGQKLAQVGTPDKEYPTAMPPKDPDAPRPPVVPVNPL